jgi:hypothetical protein
MIKTLLLCAISSFYGDWLSTDSIYDVNNDGIVNLKDYVALEQLDMNVLKRQPDPNQVEALVLKLFKSGLPMEILGYKYTITRYETIGNTIYVDLEWDKGGWFKIEWTYLWITYEFVYTYGTKLIIK